MTYCEAIKENQELVLKLEKTIHECQEQIDFFQEQVDEAKKQLVIAKKKIKILKDAIDVVEGKEIKLGKVEEHMAIFSSKVKSST